VAKALSIRLADTRYERIPAQVGQLLLARFHIPQSFLVSHFATPSVSLFDDQLRRMRYHLTVLVHLQALAVPRQAS